MFNEKSLLKAARIMIWSGSDWMPSLLKRPNKSRCLATKEPSFNMGARILWRICACQLDLKYWGQYLSSSTSSWKALFLLLLFWLYALIFALMSFPVSVITPTKRRMSAKKAVFSCRALCFRWCAKRCASIYWNHLGADWRLCLPLIVCYRKADKAHRARNQQTQLQFWKYSLFAHQTISMNLPKAQ